MPWFLVALLAVVAIVGLLALMPKPDIENARASKLGDFQFPRAKEGDPWPLIYGKVKLKAPNVLWYGDFESVPITERVRTGLFSKKTIIKGYRYYIGMALGLCLGDGVTLHRIWAGKDEMWSGTVSGDGASVNVSAESLFGGEKKQGGIAFNGRFYSGNATQTVDGYLAGHTDGADTTMMPYKCWLSTGKAYVGTTTSMKAWYFELSRYSNSLGLAGGMERIGDDMNPVEILYDIMTNKFARRGLSGAYIDLPSWQAAAITLYDEGNGASMKIEQSNTAQDVVTELLRQIDGIMYQNPATGKIVLKLIREDYDEALIPEFTEDEIEDVTNFSKTLWEDTVNQVRVTFISREQDYTDRPVIEQDMANINFQQSVRSTEIKFPAVYDKALAQVIARRELSAVSVPMFKCDIRGNRKTTRLLPGDPFKITWPDLGLDGAILRVQKYNMGTLKDGRISLTAVQDRFASLTTQQATPPDTGWQPVTDEPTNVLNARAWRAPYWFALQFGEALREPAYMFFFAEGPGGATVQYDVIATQDGDVLNALVDNIFTDVGVTLEAMPAGEATIATLQIASTDTTFGTATETELRQGRNLALIGNELVSFVTGQTTQLTTVYRGILGTAAEAHPLGTPIYFIGDMDALVTFPFTGSQISADFLAESSSAAQAPGEGINILYTPPASDPPLKVVDVEVDGQPSGGSMEAGAYDVTWAGQGPQDGEILLPSDPRPAPPVDTVYNIEVRRGSSLVHSAFDIAQPYNFNFIAHAATSVKIIAQAADHLNGTMEAFFEFFSPVVPGAGFLQASRHNNGSTTGLIYDLSQTGEYIIILCGQFDNQPTSFIVANETAEILHSWIDGYEMTYILKVTLWGKSGAEAISFISGGGTIWRWTAAAYLLGDYWLALGTTGYGTIGSGAQSIPHNAGDFVLSVGLGQSFGTPPTAAIELEGINEDNGPTSVENNFYSVLGSTTAAAGGTLAPRMNDNGENTDRTTLLSAKFPKTSTMPYILGGVSLINSTSSFKTKGNMYRATKNLGINKLRFWSQTAGMTGEFVIAKIDGTGEVTEILHRAPYSGTPAGAWHEETFAEIGIARNERFLLAVSRDDGGTSADVAYTPDTVTSPAFFFDTGNLGWRNTTDNVVVGSTNASPNGDPWLIDFEAVLGYVGTPFDFFNPASGHQSSSSTYCAKGNVEVADENFIMTHIRYRATSQGGSTGKFQIVKLDGSNLITEILQEVPYTLVTGSHQEIELATPIQFEINDRFMVAMVRTDATASTSNGVDAFAVGLVTNPVASVNAMWRSQDLGLEVGDNNDSPGSGANRWAIDYKGYII